MQNVSSAVSTALSSGTVRVRLLAERAALCVPTAVPLCDSTGAPLFVLISGPLPEGRVDGDGILSLSYHAACCDGDIGIGGVLAATISARLKGVFPLLGTVIRAQYGVEGNGAVEWLNLGRFTVTSCTRTDHETQITAYDAAYTLSGQYVPTVQSGATVYNVLADVADQCGLNVEQTTLNYGLQITVSGTLTGHSLREMLGYLAGLCGRNCVISRDGFVRFVWFEASGATITPDDYYSGTLSNGGVSSFAGLRCTVPAAQEDTVLTVGDADRAVEYNNPFMSQTRLDAVWYAVGGYEYPAGEVSFYRGLLTEPGDVVSLTNLAGVTIQLPVMQVELYLDGGGRCTVRSYGRGDVSRVCDSAGPRERRLQRVAGTASAALLSANGKNKNFYQASAPTAADGLTPGDLWFDTANGNRVSEWTGSAWTLRQFGALAVTDLDAGSVTTGILNSARIGTGSITADKIDVADLFAQNITATGSITGAALSVGTQGAQTANTGYFNVNSHGRMTAENAGIKNLDLTGKTKWLATAGNWFRVYGGSDTLTLDYDMHDPGTMTETIAQVSFAAASGGTQVSWSIHGSVAEGSGTTATGDYSHAEGSTTTASGAYSHAEGSTTTASGAYSHAEGYQTAASQGFAHAQNYYTIAQGYFQTAIGKYNVADTTSALIIGNGDENGRSNALTVDWSGNVDMGGALSRGGRAYLKAEEKSFNVTCNGNSSDSGSGSVASTGYTPLGMVGFSFGGTNSSRILPFRVYVSGNTLHWNVRNVGSSNYSGTISAQILYIAT